MTTKPLSPTSPVWDRIAADIETSFGKEACIMNILEVIHEPLKNAFEERLKDIRERCEKEGVEPIIRQMYHGTSNTSATGIIATGFNPE